MALELATWQKASGHEILIASIASLPSSKPVWFEARHGKWESIRSLDWPLRYTSISNLMTARKRLTEVLNEFQPQILHSHLWVADIVASLSVNKSKTKHIAHIHNQEIWKDSSKLKHVTRRALTRWLYRRSQTRFIACSKAVMEYETRVMGWKPNEIDVVNNFADLQKFQPTPRPRGTRIRIGAAGWLIPRKGHVFLINAVASLVSEKHDVELIIAGEGPLRNEYLKIASDLGISDRLILPGPVSDMPAFFQSIDIFCLPSLEEGLPLVIVEAMASGLCIVSSALFGMENTVVPEVTGLLFPIGNQSELTNMLRRLVLEGDLARRMGNAGRLRAVEFFSADSAVKQVENTYKATLNE